MAMGNTYRPSADELAAQAAAKEQKLLSIQERAKYETDQFSRIFGGFGSGLSAYAPILRGMGG